LSRRHDAPRGRRGDPPRRAPLDSAIAAAKAELNDPADAEVRARRLVERLALVLQGSLLVRHGDPAVADAFLARAGSRAYGTLPPGVDFMAIIDRHRPQT